MSGILMWLMLIAVTGLTKLISSKKARSEVYDVIEFYGSRWLARRRLPRARLRDRSRELDE